ncbi:MAG: helix-turn-helix transcriptional regulator [Flavobacterium sp.]|nr:helix-turn-helix transcriptional regulator [Flavobacterium sp.]
MENKLSGIKIGIKLRKLRMANGYSQEYLAEVLEVSQKTYSNMENDKSSISIDTLKKIAEEYKIDLLDLISDDKVNVHNNSLNDSSVINGVVNYNSSQELIIQMKERIED